MVRRAQLSTIQREHGKCNANPKQTGFNEEKPGLFEKEKGDLMRKDTLRIHEKKNRFEYMSTFSIQNLLEFYLGDEPALSDG